MGERVNRRLFLRLSAGGAGAGALALSGVQGTAAEAGEDAVSALSVDSLTVEAATNPLGVDVAQPRLSWVLRTSRNGATQSGYQVQVATDRHRLLIGEPAHDTGRVSSPDTLANTYTGPALKPRTRYHWRVRVWDDRGRASEWSAPAWWETGKLAEPWTATWVGAAEPPPPPGFDGVSWLGGPGWTLSGAPVGSRWFRAALDLPGEVRRARLVATADDRLAVHVHGERVLAALVPTNSWQAAHLLDVTEAVRAAGTRAVVAVEVANTGGPAGLLLRLVVDLADGTTRELGTGPGWRATDTAAEGWTAPGFDDSAWPEAAVLTAYGQGPWGKSVSVPATQLPSPLLRKDFHLAKPVTRARLYVSGLAYQETHVNGRRVSDAVLDPGFTGYDRTVFYTVHDITDLLRQGDNTVGVALGRGFWGMTTVNVWDWHLAKWRGEPRLLAELHVDHPDGSTTTIGTGDGWRLAPGPTRTDSLYAGETFDAREALPGWHTPGFTEGPQWTKAEARPGPSGTLVAQPNEPIRITSSVRPARITQPRPGTYVVDMGRTMAGWTRLSVRAAAGTRITLLHGETLNPDGTVRSVNEHVKDTRQQRDDYICAGTGVETWEPRFSYKGFRYVEVTGLPRAPRPEEVLGRLVHSDVPDASEFRCAEPMFEQLDTMMRRTIVNNLHSIPTDTPKYEKNGWTGDAQVGAPSMAYAFGMQRFLTKWLGDLADSTNTEGQVPVIVPNGGRWGYQQLAPAPEWTTVFPYLARELHRWYGDLRPAQRHWKALTAYLDWELARMRDGLAETALGDFLAPDAPWGVAPEDNRLTATAYLYRALVGTAELADLLGHKTTATRYRTAAQAAKNRVNAVFLRGGHYRSDEDQGYRQTSNAIPLAFGLVPREQVPMVVASLVADIKAKGNHLNTGCLGTSVLLPVLTAHGHADTAHRIATQRTEPSWGYWIAQGADTMWEMWHKDSRSRNHYFQGTVTQWLYENVAGLRALSNGYQRFQVRPDARAGVSWARMSLETVRGKAAVSWEETATGLKVTVVVPVGSTAEVLLPPAVTAPEGAAVVARSADLTTYEIGSGTWQFG
ncbi:alpha-L-rhamnosidase [Crossiella equi]|uniref:alpha-L-rhamnosidase n=1 Tax=Crossiella equi TaxID=130796 RepID=A0ABS5AMB0_9PSEU|nr:family 78 glycoside hydrolase catalytic domain [Crossiella equi]MBP2477522.1 alpha-L-rhamnosidase [Crossiella equi]